MIYLKQYLVVIMQQLMVFMTSNEFHRIIAKLYGYGYQTKAAIDLGVARTTVNRYVKGIGRNGKLVTIKTEVILKLRKIENDRQ